MSRMQFEDYKCLTPVKNRKYWQFRAVVLVSLVAVLFVSFHARDILSHGVVGEYSGSWILRGEYVSYILELNEDGSLVFKEIAIHGYSTYFPGHYSFYHGILDVEIPGLYRQWNLIPAQWGKQKILIHDYRLSHFCTTYQSVHDGMAEYKDLFVFVKRDIDVAPSEETPVRFSGWPVC